MRVAAHQINMGVTKPNVQFTELIIFPLRKKQRKKPMQVDFAVVI